MVLTQHGHPRGRPSRGTAGTNPKTGGHQPKDWQALPFNTVGDHEFFQDFGDCVFEVVCGSGILVGCMSLLGAVFPSFFLASLRFSLRPFQVFSVVTSGWTGQPKGLRTAFCETRTVQMCSALPTHFKPFFGLLRFWCSHARGIPFLRRSCSFTEQVLAQFEVFRICSDQGGMARASPAPTKCIRFSRLRNFNLSHSTRRCQVFPAIRPIPVAASIAERNR